MSTPNLMCMMEGRCKKLLQQTEILPDGDRLLSWKCERTGAESWHMKARKGEETCILKEVDEVQPRWSIPTQPVHTIILQTALRAALNRRLAEAHA